VERPWEQPGLGRRDAEPHRGTLLLWVATGSVVCGWLSWCLVVPSFLGLPLAVTVYILSRQDMARMRAGLMDRRGYGQTYAAWERSLDGLTLNILPFAGFAVAFVHLVSLPQA
jgi:hypothetical protein